MNIYIKRTYRYFMFWFKIIASWALMARMYKMLGEDAKVEDGRVEGQA